MLILSSWTKQPPLYTLDGKEKWQVDDVIELWFPLKQANNIVLLALHPYCVMDVPTQSRWYIVREYAIVPETINGSLLPPPPFLLKLTITMILVMSSHVRYSSQMKPQRNLLWWSHPFCYLLVTWKWFWISLKLRI